MSSVLKFLGIGNKTNNTEKVLVQSAKIQSQNAPMSSDYQIGDKFQEIQIMGRTSNAPIPENPVLPRRANIINLDSDLAKSKREVFNNSMSSSKPIFEHQQYANHSSVSPNKTVTSSRLNALDSLMVQSVAIDYADIKLRLTNLVDKSFPSPFPSRMSNPEDFDKILTCLPYPTNQIEYLLENSKNSNKSKENQINKYLNYKKETEFYKKYINMNEIKKQKLVQEIEDYRRRQGVYNNMNPNDPEYKNMEMQLRQQEQLISRERDELDHIKQQLQNQHPETDSLLQQSGVYEDYRPQYTQKEQYQPQSFAKKTNNVQAQYNQPPIQNQRNEQQLYAVNDNIPQPNQYHLNESQDWNQQAEGNQMDNYQQKEYVDYQRNTDNYNPPGQDYSYNQKQQFTSNGLDNVLSRDMSEDYSDKQRIPSPYFSYGFDPTATNQQHNESGNLPTKTLNFDPSAQNQMGKQFSKNGQTFENSPRELDLQANQGQALKKQTSQNLNPLKVGLPEKAIRKDNPLLRKL